ncbi:MAG: hypothetical protein ACR2G1_03700 [Rubrobacteraceae bacterium]
MSGSYTGHGMGVKVDFGHIYDLEDPRGYFNTLSGLDYQAPQHGSRIFDVLLEEKNSKGRPAKIVDVCCSYGINAALLKTDLTLQDLYARYGSQQLAELPPEELAAADNAFYEDHRLPRAPEVVGVDVAQNAVSYALQAGLLDAGFAENLENEEPSEALRTAVVGADIVTVTGGIGYVWENTFDRLLSCFDKNEMPWVATFPLRMVDYASLGGLLEDHGLETEKLDSRSFQQRRFVDDRERDHVLQKLSEADIDPNGKEDSGWYHSELYLSRPSGETGKVALNDLPGISSAA